MSPTISLQSKVSASPHQVSSRVGDEAVILGLARERYYGLNSVGAFLWDRLQTPCNVAELRDAVMAEYEVDRNTCERDILALLSQFVDEGLVEILDVKPSQ